MFSVFCILIQLSIVLAAATDEKCIEVRVSFFRRLFVDGSNVSFAHQEFQKLVSIWFCTLGVFCRLFDLRAALGSARLLSVRASPVSPGGCERWPWEHEALLWFFIAPAGLGTPVRWLFAKCALCAICRPEPQQKAPSAPPPPPPPPPPPLPEPAPPEPEEEILGSDDEEQEDPADYCKGERRSTLSGQS